MILKKYKSGRGHRCILRCDVCSYQFDKIYAIIKDNINHCCSSKCHFILLGKKRKELNNQKSIFKKFDTEQECYWLGYIYGDGCLIIDRGYKYISVICKSSDKKHLQKLANWCSVSLNERSSFDKRTKKKYFAIQMRITNELDCNLLQSKGLKSRKSVLSMKIPNIDKSCIHHFIRGYFDADGSVGIFKRKSHNDQLRFSICNGHPDILENIAQYLRFKCNSILTVNKHSSANCWIIATAGNSVCYQLYNYLYQDASIYLKRKQQIFEKFYEKYT